MIAVACNTVKRIFAIVPLDPMAMWGVPVPVNGHHVGD
jgi:hypothetical protein